MKVYLLKLVVSLTILVTVLEVGARRRHKHKKGIGKNIADAMIEPWNKFSKSVTGPSYKYWHHRYDNDTGKWHKRKYGNSDSDSNESNSDDSKSSSRESHYDKAALKCCDSSDSSSSSEKDVYKSKLPDKSDSKKSGSKISGSKKSGSRKSKSRKSGSKKNKRIQNRNLQEPEESTTDERIDGITNNPAEAHEDDENTMPFAAQVFVFYIDHFGCDNTTSFRSFMASYNEAAEQHRFAGMGQNDPLLHEMSILAEKEIQEEELRCPTTCG